MSQEFLEGFHAFTEICFPVSVLLFLFVIFVLTSILRNGTSPIKRAYRGLYLEYGWKFIAILIIALLIFLNSVCHFIFQKEDMYALYEKNEYSQNYEAYLYENEDSEPLFCIVEITHNDDYYTITKIHYSQGIEETEIEYYPNKEYHTVFINRWDDLEFSLRIGRIADEDSFNRLENETYDYEAVIADPYYVTDQKTVMFMYSQPDFDSLVIGEVLPGADIVVSSYEGDWGYTNFNGKSGWVDLTKCTWGFNPDPTVISLDTIVYYTEKGEKFHLIGCPTIANSDPYSDTIYTVHSIYNREPCKVCFPGLDLAELY